MSTELTVMKVKTLVAERCGVGEGRVTMEARLVGDLGMTPGEAERFVAAFVGVFGVEAAGGVELASWLGKGRGWESLRVRDLVRAADTGVWFE